jgi:hypothetical protein
MVTIADDANNSDQQPTQPVKICSKCYETKPTTEFHRSAINKDGLIGYCKICHNKQVSKSKKIKNYYLINRLHQIKSFGFTKIS